MAVPETLVKATRYLFSPVGQYIWAVIDPGEPSMAPPLDVNDFPAAATEEKISPLNFSATPYAPYSPAFDYRDYRAVLNFIYGRDLSGTGASERLTHVGHVGVAITQTVQETGEDYDLV